jgi:hypothetical protein
MPNISFQPVARVNLFIDISDIKTFEEHRLLLDLADEIVASFVPANEFWDACTIDGPNRRIVVNYEIHAEDVMGFMQKVCQAWAVYASAKL